MKLHLFIQREKGANCCGHSQHHSPRLQCHCLRAATHPMYVTKHWVHFDLNFQVVGMRAGALQHNNIIVVLTFLIRRPVVADLNASKDGTKQGGGMEEETSAWTNPETCFSTMESTHIALPGKLDRKSLGQKSILLCCYFKYVTGLIISPTTHICLDQVSSWQEDKGKHLWEGRKRGGGGQGEKQNSGHRICL